MKIVCFTQRVEIITSYNERRDCADQNIARFISSCGYLPVPLPNLPDAAESIVAHLQPFGIVFTGGNNLLPYDGDAPERDEAEARLLQLALQKDIPVYGFCRGMQMILHAFGTKLQRVSDHVAVKHTIHGSIGEREVNSYHNWGCMSVDSDKFEVLAKTEDGVIEAVRLHKGRVLGTMWHPERCTPFQENDIDMVKRLFEKEER